MYHIPKDVSLARLEFIRSFRGRKARMKTLTYGYATPEEEVLKMFAGVVLNHSDYYRVFKLVGGEDSDVIGIPSRSRWNLKKPHYKQDVKKRLRKETHGLDKATLVTLTYEPSRVERANPYFFLDDRFWLTSECWKHLKIFLGRLERYRKRQGLRWNYIAAVVEFQGSGYIHFHLIFAGGWVAPIEKLAGFWDWSASQGVDVKRCDNFNTVAYLVKYLGKASKMVTCAGAYHIGFAGIYFFGVRLFNIRHGNRRGARLESSVKYELVGLAYCPDGDFRGVVHVAFKIKGSVEEFDDG